MKKLQLFIVGVLLFSNLSASQYLTLIPTHTNGFERNFNPYEPTIGSFFAQDFIYEPLWIFNVWHPENDFPRLAQAYEMNADFTRLTYHLRQDVLWSDGRPFSAADVVFTMNYAKQHPDLQIPLSIEQSDGDGGLIRSVQAINSSTVEIQLAWPNAQAHQQIGTLYPLPKHIFESVNDPAEFANLTPVGTGPFTEITQFRTTHFKICRNQNYYQAEELHVDCLKFPHFSGNEQLWAAARLGKVDWMGEGIQDPVENYTKHRDTNKTWLAPGSVVNLQINTTKAPLNDIALRRAMSMAIDRKRLHEVDTFGLTTPAEWPVGTGPLYNSWYDEETLSPYRKLMSYSPEKAKILLDNAGYFDVDSDGFREQPGGEPFIVGIAVPSGWTDWVNSVMTIADNLRAVGINAKIEAMDEQRWFDRVPTGDFDIFIMWTNAGISPWTPYSGIFNSDNMTPGQLDFQTMHQMQSDQVTDWLNAYSHTADITQQKKYMSNIQTFVAQQLPVITLFANPVWYQYSDRKFTGWVTQDNPYVRPQVHKGVPERLIHLLHLRPRVSE